MTDEELEDATDEMLECLGEAVDEAKASGMSAGEVIKVLRIYLTELERIEGEETAAESGA